MIHQARGTGQVFYSSFAPEDSLYGARPLVYGAWKQPLGYQGCHPTGYQATTVVSFPAVGGCRSRNGSSFFQSVFHPWHACQV